MKAFWIDRILNRPWQAVVLCLLILGASLPLLPRLWLTIDYKIYFEPDDPQLRAMEEMERTFIEDNTLVVMVAPEQGEVFQPRVLSLIDRLTEAGWQIPHALRVDSLTNYSYSRASGDEVEIFPLFENPDSLTVEDIRQRRQWALEDPALVGSLLSDDGRVAAVVVTVSIPDNPVREVPEIATAMRGVLQDLQQTAPDVRLFLNGTVMADQSFADAIAQDSQWLTPLSYLIIFGLIALLLRSPLAMLMTAVVIVAAVLVAFGAKALFNPAINTVTVLAPSVIMIVSVADAMHLFASYFQRQREGEPVQAALRHALDINWQPVILTSLTTAVGFLSLNFSKSPPLRDMGNTVAVGTLAAMFFSLVLLPALIRLRPVRAPRPWLWLARIADRVAGGVVRYPGSVIGISLLVGGVLLAGLPRNALNEVYVEYFDKTFAFRQANDFMNEHLRGPHRLSFVLDSGRENGVFDPEFLRKVEEFAAFLEAQPEVTDVDRYTLILKRLNRNMHGDDPAAWTLPRSREEAAQYTLLYEMSLPFGQSLTQYLDIRRQKTRVTAAVQLTSSAVILDLDARAQAWLATHLPESVVPAVSLDTMFSHIAQDNIPAMVEGTVLALVLISGLIMVATRSLSIGLISLLPNLLPMAMAFGLWGFLYGRIGLTESTIASLTMGLIVDDTVHMLTKYLRARRDLGLSAAEAVRYALGTVGEAVIMTSVVFSAGFGVLALSHFTGNSHLGALTAITIVLALLADLFLLPALLVKFDRLNFQPAEAAGHS